MEEATREKIESLKARAAERETTRYSQIFKDDAIELVCELRRDGWTQKAVSEALGIPWVTLRRWKKKDSPDESVSGFRPVTVVADDQNPVLVSPSGWRIEGLTLGQIVEITGRLST